MTMPKDPMGPLAIGAASTHEMFLAYVQAGFTREEALHIVTALSVEVLRIGNGYGQ